MPNGSASDDRGPSQRVESIVGKSSRLSGDLVFSGQLRINGEFVGNIYADEEDPRATVVIDGQARVTGNIAAPYIVSDGVIIGDVHARRVVKLMSGGQVRGDLRYGVLEVESGARISGKLTPIETV